MAREVRLAKAAAAATTATTATKPAQAATTTAMRPAPTASSACMRLPRLLPRSAAHTASLSAATTTRAACCAPAAARLHRSLSTTTHTTTHTAAATPTAAAPAATRVPRLSLPQFLDLDFIITAIRSPLSSNECDLLGARQAWATLQSLSPAQISARGPRTIDRIVQRIAWHPAPATALDWLLAALDMIASSSHRLITSDFAILLALLFKLPASDTNAIERVAAFLARFAAPVLPTKKRVSSDAVPLDFLGRLLNRAIESQSRPAIDAVHEAFRVRDGAGSLSAASMCRLMEIHAQNDSLAEATALYQKLASAPHHGIRDSATLSSHVIYLARAGNPSDAESLIQSFEGRFTPSSSAYIAILVGYIKQRDYELARLWLAALPDSCPEALPAAWGIWIRKLLQVVKDVRTDAVPIIDEAIASFGHKADARFWLNIIYGCASRGELDQAYIYEQIMDRMGIHKPPDIHAALLYGEVLHCGNMTEQQMREIQERIDALLSTPLGPAAERVYHMIISAYLTVYQFDPAMRLYERMVAPTSSGGAGIRPNEHIIHSFLVYFVHTRQLQEGFAMYSRMMADGGVVNERVYNVLLELARFNVELMFSTWQRLQDHVQLRTFPAIKPLALTDFAADTDRARQEDEPTAATTSALPTDAPRALPVPSDDPGHASQVLVYQGLSGSHYRALVFCLLRYGRYEDAKQAITEMSNRRIELSPSTYVLLAQARRRSGDPDGAVKILSMAQRAGIYANRQFYHAYMRALLDIGRQDRVLALLEEMLDRDINPTALTFTWVGLANALDANLDGLCRDILCGQALGGQSSKALYRHAHAMCEQILAGDHGAGAAGQVQTPPNHIPKTYQPTPQAVQMLDERLAHVAQMPATIEFIQRCVYLRTNSNALRPLTARRLHAIQVFRSTRKPPPPPPPSSSPSHAE
ncbi:hypothetical protein BC831DRAFT_448564 [Entophlyctis helioformis]|nr:hypothetical protein BC831DRAFT_448564 [Entophlyctis helioformis]